MNYQELKTYIETFATHNQLNNAFMGSLDELLSGLRTKKDDDYPLLFVTEPINDTTTNEADTTLQTVTLTFTVLGKKKKGFTHDDRANLLATLEPIINDVIGKLDEDIYQETFPIKRYAEVQGRGPNIAEPIGPSALIGWTYEMEFTHQSTIQFNPDNWN